MDETTITPTTHASIEAKTPRVQQQPQLPQLLVQRLATNDPTLTRLKLVHEPTDYFTWGESSKPQETGEEGPGATEVTATYLDFLQALQNNTIVESVVLERIFVRGLNALQLNEVIQTLAGGLVGLQEMELRNVTLPLDCLCAAVGKAHKLGRLGIGFVTLKLPVTNTKYADGLRNHPALQNIYLSDFVVQLTEPEPVQETSLEEAQQQQTMSLDSSLDPFLRALGTCRLLKFVELFSNRTVVRNEVDEAVPVCPFSSAGLAALCLNARSLQTLTLRRLGLTAAHLSGMVQAITCSMKERESDSPPHSQSVLECLRALDLSDNELSDDGSVALLKAMLQATRNDPPEKSSTSLCALREINLRSNHITETGCCLIADAFSSETTSTLQLEKLNLSANPLRDKGATALADLLATSSTSNGSSSSPVRHWKYLDLYKAEITDKGCSRLAEAMTNNTHLISIGLHYNFMTDVTYLAFAKALTTNRSLKHVNLQVDHKKVTVVACQALLEMVQDNWVIESISTLLTAGEFTSVKAIYASYIERHLRLNHAGRGRLVQNANTTPNDWIQTIKMVDDDLSAIFYLVRMNPLMFCAPENQGLGVA